MIIRDETFYTATEVANLTGLCVKTIKRKVKEGKLIQSTEEGTKAIFLGANIKKWLKM